MKKAGERTNRETMDGYLKGRIGTLSQERNKKDKWIDGCKGIPLKRKERKKREEQWESKKQKKLMDEKKERRKEHMGCSDSFAGNKVWKQARGKRCIDKIDIWVQIPLIERWMDG